MVYWFNPVFERFPLLFLSRAIFGNAPPLRDVMNDWRQAVVPGILGAMTIRRLSPRRSFDAPVWVLERASSEMRRARLQVLSGRASGAAFWLTIIGVHIESFLALAGLVCIWVFLPGDDATGLFAQSNVWYEWTWVVVSVACASLIAPFYVACGFCLYLL